MRRNGSVEGDSSVRFMARLTSIAVGPRGGFVARGFTLVELLVVVTIIVILIALLAPALDRAMYTAQVAVCSAQLHTMTIGAAQYAMDHKRHYFYREGARAPDVDWFTNQVYSPGGAGPRHQRTHAYDDRPLFKPYFPLKILIDPMAGNVDVEREPKSFAQGTAEKDDPPIWVSYNLWVGINIHGSGAFGQPPTGPSLRGMFKMGDRLEYDRYEFNVMFSDIHRYNWNWPGGAECSHSDQTGTMNLGDKSEKWTANTHYIGPVDVNHAFQDGSVRNYGSVPPPGGANAGVEYGPFKSLPILTLHTPSNVTGTMNFAPIQ
jgi:prepilin-type N-terminal cleavage/methylation domain-containing protein